MLKTFTFNSKFIKIYRKIAVSSFKNHVIFKNNLLYLDIYIIFYFFKNITFITHWNF